MIEENQNPYPAECHFKIIGGNDDGLLERIREALATLELDVPVTMGNASAEGKYITYNLTVRVEDRPHMETLDTTFRAIEGVKIVL